MGQHSGNGMGEERRDSGLAEFVYKQVSKDLTISKDEFFEGLKDWELKPIEVDGELAAVVAVKGNELHVSSGENFRGKWLSRRVIKNVLGVILSEYGQAITCVNWGNKAACEFVERLGFVPDNIVYRLDKLKHVRER